MSAPTGKPQAAPAELVRKWIARAIHRGLELGVLGPDLVLAHATAEVLAEHLPPDIVAKVLSDALGAGRLEPSGVLASAPAQILATHLPPAVLWAALEDAAKRTGISTEAP